MSVKFQTKMAIAMWSSICSPSLKGLREAGSILSSQKVLRYAVKV